MNEIISKFICSAPYNNFLLDRLTIFLYNSTMFIKKISKTNKGYDKTFIYHRLMESYRTEHGPRQRTVLNLGKLDIASEQWKLLADRIEQIVTGQDLLFPIEEKVEQLARHYSNVIIQNKLLPVEIHQNSIREKNNYETVDINSFTNSQCRTIGAEYVGYKQWKDLGLGNFLSRLGFSQKQVNLAALLVVGKLVNPASELATAEWARDLTGLDELMGTSFRHLSENMLYRTSDLLLKHKEKIELYLCQKERAIFSLKEKIILYDLTNTYFEGASKHNPKARRGRSKDKQKGRPLITLGLVIDELGFPKVSKVFAGDVGETKTLLEMVESLDKNCQKLENGEKKDVMVIMDAGISSEENLKLLKEKGYDYICVARNKPELETSNEDRIVVVKKDRKNKVTAKLFKRNGENILYCWSLTKEKKEQEMKTLFQQRWEKGLEKIKASLKLPRGIKEYEQVLERIGRLKEKYRSIAHYYQIEVEQKDGLVLSIRWDMEKKDKMEERFAGKYFLRTSRTDLKETELWSLYTTLTNVEDSFRCFKDELNLRPVHHQKENRCDGHLFITVLAYHLLNSIRYKLTLQGIKMRWGRTRQLLSSQVRITSSFTTKERQQIHLKNTSQAEPFHRKIYTALGLNPLVLAAKLIKM